LFSILFGFYTLVKNGMKKTLTILK